MKKDDQDNNPLTKFEMDSCKLMAAIRTHLINCLQSAKPFFKTVHDMTVHGESFKRRQWKKMSRRKKNVFNILSLFNWPLDVQIPSPYTYEELKTKRALILLKRMRTSTTHAHFTSFSTFYGIQKTVVN